MQGAGPALPGRERVPATIAAVSTPMRSRVKSLPWLAMLQASVILGNRWRALSEKDRARLTRLVRESRGRLGNLSDRERQELRRLVGKLDLKGAGPELTVLVRGRRWRKHP
jgi:hypothetical protein